MGAWVTDLASEWMKAVFHNTPTSNLYRPGVNIHQADSHYT